MNRKAAKTHWNIILSDNLQHSDRFYVNLSWVRVHAFEFGVLQLVLDFWSAHLNKGGFFSFGSQTSITFNKPLVSPTSKLYHIGKPTMTSDSYQIQPYPYGHYFIWHLAVSTSCRLSYRTNVAHPADPLHARQSSGGKWQKTVGR